MKPSWEWTEEDLLQMKVAQTQESLYLEFKRSPALLNTNSNKAEIAKDVSAFANSAGGDILYGVSETDDSPATMKDVDEGVDPNMISPEWLEQVINSNIQPRISGIRINHVRLQRVHPGRCVYVVHIPASDNAPHQASDKRYYKRFNFMSIPMEDYEIRDISNRSRKPVLTVDGEIIKANPLWLTGLRMIITGSAPVTFPSFNLRVWLFNTGQTTAKNLDMVLTFENIKIEKVIGPFVRIDKIRDGKPCLQWSGLDEIIHPQHGKMVADIYLKVIDLKKRCSVLTELSAEDFVLRKHLYVFHNSSLLWANVRDSTGRKRRLFLSNLEKWDEENTSRGRIEEPNPSSM